MLIKNEQQYLLHGLKSLLVNLGIHPRCTSDPQPFMDFVLHIIHNAYVVTSDWWNTVSNDFACNCYEGARVILKSVP
jgi:hypothetical protein